MVEEIGDYFNMAMMGDERLEPIARLLNDIHHRDESRHIAFGRLHLREMAEKWLPTFDDDTREGFQRWLAQYLKSSWADFYNPTMYKDAGLASPYDVRRVVMSHPAPAALREAASKKLVGLFLDCGLLAEEPAL